MTLTQWWINSVPYYEVEAVREFIDKLRPFLGHDVETCIDDPCTCGLDALLKEVER